MKTIRTVCCVAVILMTVAASVPAQEPGWMGQVIVFGHQREVIESTPILRRPYRPLHFYGNTVRRRYYRGRTAPAPRDVSRGGAAMVRGR